MPMVDHLEELRRRLFWSLGAVAVATAVALFVVFTFPVIRTLELPIQPYLPSHKLAFTHPTDPFDIAMHTPIAFGIVAAFPILLHQAWGFVRPAMTTQERRAFAGWLADRSSCSGRRGARVEHRVAPRGAVAPGFADGCAHAHHHGSGISRSPSTWRSRSGLASSSRSLTPGLVWLDIVTPQRLAELRRVALFGSVLVGALLTPGDLVWTTIAMAAPLYALYELSIVAGRRVARRRRY
jgi:sec-independent protein translocase protein TatC